MDFGLIAQYVANGVMLGTMYALVAVGFTLFFGVLDVVKFSHGDVLMLGTFAGFTVWLGLEAVGIVNPWLQLIVILIASMAFTAAAGAVIAKWLVLPLKKAPPLNILLVTLMLGTAIRECVRLFYPNGSNPKAFPALLPDMSVDLGGFLLRADSVILVIAGLSLIIGLSLVLNHTRLGLAIRAVAQDEETARIMGINYMLIVLATFAIGSGVAAFAGVMNGLYYNEINFNMGVLLGLIGFSAAIVGGLGNLYGAILGGFMFAALQTIGAAVLPFASAYKDVFAFAVVIAIMAWKPTGLIPERTSDRV
ncbi:branched-chain amino acid ABC transporter permease [Martelella mangrovi]|uniref:Branched-chain amino acid transport system permease protein n=1 Tax=Martelella mangrovi TaxID=1397477 RepID=A0ABV2IF09_9HYPH